MKYGLSWRISISSDTDMIICYRLSNEWTELKGQKKAQNPTKDKAKFFG